MDDADRGAISLGREAIYDFACGVGGAIVDDNQFVVRVVDVPQGSQCGFYGKSFVARGNDDGDLGSTLLCFVGSDVFGRDVEVGAADVGDLRHTSRGFEDVYEPDRCEHPRSPKVYGAERSTGDHALVASSETLISGAYRTPMNNNIAEIATATVTARKAVRRFVRSEM